MSQNLYDHLPLIDETHSLHQSTAMDAKQWVNFPDFFDALTPNQGRNFLRAKIAYDNYLSILLCRFLRLV